MSSGLSVEAYKKQIMLEKAFMAENEPAQEMTDREEIVNELLEYLGAGGLVFFGSYEKKRNKLNEILTQRYDPLPLWFNSQLDRILQAETAERGVISLDELITNHSQTYILNDSSIAKIALWQGDITRLAVDGIVNAANTQLLGCFRPFHNCIDNVIHSCAGPRLREDCGAIMALQGYQEPTGSAKITRAYNLPSKYVLHTVGPIIEGGMVTSEDAEQLSRSYTSCLDLCSGIPTIRSLAFCGISTGVFGFPVDHAARLALSTIKRWIKKNPDAMDLIVINVFKGMDHGIYAELLLRDNELSAKTFES